MREPKFNFTRLDKVGIEEDDVMTITINKKGIMFLTREFLNTYKVNGKFMEFFGDSSKRTLAWRFKDTLNDLKELKPKKDGHIRVVRQNAKSGQAVLSIKTLLDRLRIDLDDYKKLPVKEYSKDTIYGHLYYAEIPYNKVIKPTIGEDEEID